jgi:hypothetical protein
MKCRGYVSLWVASLAATVVACGGDDKEAACHNHRAKIELCNREFTNDPCATAGQRCATACYARLSCNQFSAVDAKMPPASLSACLSLCAPPFNGITCPDGTKLASSWMCDGEEDCADGRDERDCSYFMCSDGQAIARSGVCDDYENCNDGSDEAQCP